MAPDDHHHPSILLCSLLSSVFPCLSVVWSMLVFIEMNQASAIHLQEIGSGNQFANKKRYPWGFFWIRSSKVFCPALFKACCLEGAPLTKLQVTCTFNTSVGCGITLHLPKGGFSYSSGYCITFLTSTQNKTVRIKQCSLRFDGQPGDIATCLPDKPL